MAVVAVGVIWVSAAAETAQAQCCPTAVKPAAAKAPTDAAAGPKGAKGAKAGAAAEVHLRAALAALDKAEKAIAAGDKKAAAAALAEARKLVTAQHKTAAKRAGKTRILNAVCPMTGKPIAAAATRKYKGQTVAFCGPGCASAWDKGTDAKRDAILAKLTAAAKGAKGPTGAYANVRCPIMGGLINPKKVTASVLRTYKGEKVAFCCPGCPAAWDKLGAAQKEAKLAKARKK
jgi:hypothetical protein